MSCPIETAAFEAVAVRTPVGPMPGRVASAASDATFNDPDVALTSPRSVIPAGGVTVVFVAEPKNAMSIDPALEAETDGAVMVVPLGFA
jgi:hypothetical protein